jgi:hypothetical protein
MYIICAIITILVGVLGFFVLPETPGKVYNADFVQLANLRCVIISSIGHSPLEWIHEYHYL